jgi:hypothetical protein
MQVQGHTSGSKICGSIPHIPVWKQSGLASQRISSERLKLLRDCGGGSNPQSCYMSMCEANIESMIGKV